MYYFYIYTGFISIIIGIFIDNKYFVYTGISFVSVGFLLTPKNEISEKKPLKKSCLSDKTELQKNHFFKSLYKFKETDVIFYNEQLHDLNKDDLEEFNCWIFNNEI